MRKIYGVGINDSDYKTQKTSRVNGKSVSEWICPYYDRWCGMLRRCYSAAYKLKNPTYRDCTVCEEWLTFSNFKSWMEKQDWKGKQLDKDLLVVGNKVYSPDTCMFIDKTINDFIKENKRGDLPYGVTKFVNRYAAQCSNPFIPKEKHIGYYGTPEEAHLAWKSKKAEYAKQLIETQLDPRVIRCLTERFVSPISASDLIVKKEVKEFYGIG